MMLHLDAKDWLEDRIKEYADKPMSNSVAEHLCVYAGALMALDGSEEIPKLKHSGTHDGLSHEDMRKWVTSMSAPAPGMPSGQHWSKSDTDAVLRQYGFDDDEWDFWVCINMMWSDFYGAASKVGITSDRFFAEMAHAWLNDDDAVDDKLCWYYEYIVEH